MRGFDLSPLFRTSVGYDRMARLMEGLASEPTSSYPPYNIEKLSEDDYVITMAVAGFRDEDIDITLQHNQLTIAGRIASKADIEPDTAETAAKRHEAAEPSDNERIFLYRGIAERAFERRFTLADHIQVTGARLENGLLHVDLVRLVPETAKPRRIEIQSGLTNLVTDASKKADSKSKGKVSISH